MAGGIFAAICAPVLWLVGRVVVDEWRAARAEVHTGRPWSDVLAEALEDTDR